MVCYGLILRQRGVFRNLGPIPACQSVPDICPAELDFGPWQWWCVNHRTDHMTDTPKSARIEVFRPGTFTPMQGEPILYSAADLRAIVDAYDPETAPAPIVVGHPDTDAPAYGWVKGFHFDPQEERLFADLHEIEPEFAELVKAGRYKKVSMSFFGPDQSSNPNPGAWYPKHVGFLGAAAPAVSGLKNVSLADGDAVTFEFGERGFEETASLFQMIREFLIEQFGKESADSTLPPYRIEWLGDMEIDPPGQTGFASLPKAQPTQALTPAPEPVKEPDVSPKPTDPSFAQREASLTAREQKIAAREAQLAHDDNAAFADGLVEAGKLIPASRDKVVAILNALPVDQSVSFAEGDEKLSPGDALRQVLDAQPEVVSYGTLDLPGSPTDAKPASFASDGKPVDPVGLEIHHKALDYVKSHPGTEYMAAVAAVS